MSEQSVVQLDRDSQRGVGGVRGTEAFSINKQDVEYRKEKLYLIKNKFG